MRKEGTERLVESHSGRGMRMKTDGRGKIMGRGIEIIWLRRGKGRRLVVKVECRY